jgi:hypothetical protein
MIAYSEGIHVGKSIRILNFPDEATKSYSFIFRQEDKPDFFCTNFAYNNSLKMTN